MRRRDATSCSPLHHRRHRPAAIALSLSLGVHAAMLAVATRAALPIAAPAGLIRVALRNSAGSAPSDPDAARLRDVPFRPVSPPESAPPVSRGAPIAKHARMNRGQAAARLLARQRTAGAPITASGSDHANDRAEAQPYGGGTGFDARGSGNGSGTGDGFDARAACLYCPKPHYPLIARSRGWEGTVHVGLSVSADGTVAQANLRRSSGYGVLDEAAMAVARQSRFNPSQGLPAPLRGRIVYRFELSTAR